MVKEYLGDSVYLTEDDRLGLKLTTENGFKPSNTIYLDSDVLFALLRTLGQLYDRSRLHNAIDGKR